VDVGSVCRWYASVGRPQTALQGIGPAGRGRVGVVARRQLLALGLTTEAIRHCVATGRLHPMRPIESHPGRYYVNVHNARYPGGAVRGPLRR
jgi:hypothetical protein